MFCRSLIPSVTAQKTHTHNFRQNISGSKFFHILNETSTESEEENVGGEHNHVPVPMKDDTDCTSNEVLFTFNPRDFSLCFNASQFQLDPSLQPVSTLTKTGAKFAQKAGKYSSPSLLRVTVSLLNLK